MSLGLPKTVIRPWDEAYFSLSPFIHSCEGFKWPWKSYVCFYNMKKDGKYWYEPVKIRDEKTFDALQSRFEAEKSTLAGLLA